MSIQKSKDNKSYRRPRLGVNIDHIATLRQARRSPYPKPSQVIELLKNASVDQVTLHIREDRRHVNENDYAEIYDLKLLPLNLEMALSAEIFDIIKSKAPERITFVPEKREEITTEGGLDVKSGYNRIADFISQCHAINTEVSLFIDPDPKMIELSAQLKAEAIEIHTGRYADLAQLQLSDHLNPLPKNHEIEWAQEVQEELERISCAVQMARGLGLKVYAGHGLHTQNIRPLLLNSEIEEYNIGHSLIARSVFVGLDQAVREMIIELEGCHGQ